MVVLLGDTFCAPTGMSYAKNYAFLQNLDNVIRKMSNKSLVCVFFALGLFFHEYQKIMILKAKPGSTIFVKFS